MKNEEELVRYQPGRTLTPLMNLTVAKSRLAEFQQFVKEYMVEGEDYGQIPGTPKKTLYKPGADKLCELYGLSDSYRVIDRLVDFDRGLFDYEIECTLSRDAVPIATGLGSCSSYEGKYRWRESQRRCPQCGKETIIKGKEEYGGGWLCFAKKGGCGAKFAEDDERIMAQMIGQVENDDIATLKNTILKMAKKRAKIDATLAATRSSGVFTQDAGEDEQQGKRQQSSAPVQQPQRKSKSQQQSGQSPQANPEIISDGERKHLYSIAKNAGYSDEQFRQVISACGYASSSEVKRKHYEVIRDCIEGAPIEQLSQTIEYLGKWCQDNQ